MQRSSPAPTPMAYSDYRRFLGEWFEWAKIHRKMTRQRFAALAELKGHTLYGMILKGERGLTPNTARRFAKVMKLGARETDYLLTLVSYNDAKDNRSRIDAMTKLQSLDLKHGSNFRTEVSSRDDYLKDWYVPAVRELLKLPRLEHSPEVISKATGGRVTIEQVNEALETLERLKMIERDPATGRYRVSSETFELSEDKKDLIIRRYHSQVLRYAIRATEEQGYGDRSLSSLCVVTNRRNLARLKERMDEVRREMNLLLSEGAESGDGDQVVYLNFQLLQLCESEAP